MLQTASQFLVSRPQGYELDLKSSPLPQLHLVSPKLCVTPPAAVRPDVQQDFARRLTWLYYQLLLKDWISAKLNFLPWHPKPQQKLKAAGVTDRAGCTLAKSSSYPVPENAALDRT